MNREFLSDFQNNFSQSITYKVMVIVLKLISCNIAGICHVSIVFLTSPLPCAGRPDRRRGREGIVPLGKGVNEHANSCLSLSPGAWLRMEQAPELLRPKWAQNPSNRHKTIVSCPWGREVMAQSLHRLGRHEIRSGLAYNPWVTAG